MPTPHPPDRPARGGGSQRLRRGAWAALLAVALLAAGGLVAPALLAAWVERALRAELASRGVEDVRIGSLRLGLRESAVHDLVLGDEEVVARRIRAGYGLTDLLRGRVARIALEGVRARGGIGSDAPGALAALLQSVGGTDDAARGAGGLDAPPFRALDVTDLRLAVQTPIAEIQVDVEGALAHRDARWVGALRARIDSAPDRLRGRAQLSAQPGDEAIALSLLLTGDALAAGPVTLDAFHLALAGTLTDARLAADVALGADGQTPLGPASLLLPRSRLALDLGERRGTLEPADTADAPRAGALTLGAQYLQLSGLGGALQLAPRPQARLHVDRLRDLREPPRFPALALDAELEWPGERRVRGSGTLRGLADRLVLHVEGLHDLAAADGRVHLRLTPIAFGPDGPRPSELSPRVSWLEATGGRLSAEGDLVWEDGALRSDLDLALDGLAGRAAGVAFEGLDARVRLTRPWPPAAPPGQTLAAARVARGLEAEQLAVRFALEPPGVLDVASAQARLLGGTLHTRGRFDPSRPRHDFVLALSGLDLTALVERLRLDGLSAAGRVSGQVPLALRDGGVFVEGGALSADGDGVLRYRPEPGAALGADDPKVALLLDALRDFHYERLRITLAGALLGDLDIGVHLAGSSPDFYEGHPVEFNLNLEAPIAALLRDLEVESLPERILRELRQTSPERSEEGAP